MNFAATIPTPRLTTKIHHWIGNQLAGQSQLVLTASVSDRVAAGVAGNFAVSPSLSWQSVINYIDSKFEDYLNAESRVNRRKKPDGRVHCCLYFIAPSGHG